MHEIRKMIAFTQIKFSWYFRGFTLVSWECLESKRFKIFLRREVHALKYWICVEGRKNIIRSTWRCRIFTVIRKVTISNNKNAAILLDLESNDERGYFTYFHLHSSSI